MTPATYRRGGRGMHIRFSIVDCSLGYLLVATTSKGICSVSLGSSEILLEAALRREYSDAEVHRDDEALREWVQALLKHLEGGKSYLELPLDIQATAFQWRVWKALQAIPYGGTSSYTEIAKVIGHPQAARAVAHACATNPVALVIPCHRVVLRDGELGGYRWSLGRKRKLLQRERSSIVSTKKKHTD